MDNQVKRVTLFGLPIDIINDDNFEQTINKIQTSPKQEQIKLLSYRDLISTLFSREKKIRLKSCALVVPTSLRINKAINFLHKTSPKLYNQFNFTIRLMGHIESQRGTVYLIGGAKKDTIISESNLKASFPGIRFIGRFKGRFKKNQETNLIEAVRKASPSLLLTGKGIKSKDKWLYKNKEQLSRGLSIYSDECFYIFAGKKSSKTNNLVKLFTKPWIIFDLFSMIWFYPLLLTQRIKRKE